MQGWTFLLHSLPNFFFMKPSLHLDFETFSEAELKDVGAYRYAFSEDTEILCAAMALGDEEPVVWTGLATYMAEKGQKLGDYWTALEDPSVLIYCHNAMFEMAICQALLQKTWGIPCPDLSRFRCTMSLARRAALPAKLETLAEVLGLKHQKDNRGKALIKKFSVMQSPKKPTKKFPEGQPARRIRPEDEPEAFAEFCDYCRQDVKVEQDVSRKLAYFDSEPNNSNYSLDAIINARGVPVNLSALRHAQKLIEEETEIVSQQFRELVGFEVTQGAKLLEWLKTEGCDLPDLQKETIENFLEKYDL
jgi:DNA polymerase